MKNLSSNSSLKIITQKALPPRPCSLVLCSPFHCPSGSCGWQLQRSSVNHQCLEYFTQGHSLPMMGTPSPSVLGLLRSIFLSFLSVAQQYHTAPAHPGEARRSALTPRQPGQPAPPRPPQPCVPDPASHRALQLLLRVVRNGFTGLQ